MILAGFAFLVCVGAFTGIGGMAAARLMRLQFAPALLRSLTGISVGALVIAAAILLSAWLFGRFYCSFCCPFGIMQDIVVLLSRRKKVSVPNLKKTRVVLTSLTLGMAAAGWNMGFLLLDPYSNSGRIFGAFVSGGFVVLAVIAALAVWKKRIFCTAFCPAGTMLGWAAKRGVFRLEIGENCVKCGKCGRSCPVSCIDVAAGTIDNERCVRCLACAASCPLQAISFSRRRPKPQAPADASRRAFLIHGSIFLAGVAAGAALAKTGLQNILAAAKKLHILPPGAGSPEHFAAKCTACQLCTANCPAGIIVSSRGGSGVELDLSRGNCKFNCNKCSQICPTGAIAPLTLAVKQKTKIAEAVLDASHCLVYQGEVETCGRCGGVCPTGAIRLRKNTAPRPVDPSLCIGCGACQYVCPAPGKAMTVHAVERQTLLSSEEQDDE